MQVDVPTGPLQTSIMLTFDRVGFFRGITRVLGHGHVRPFAAVLVALLLISLPFATVRGVTNRLMDGHIRTGPES
jgi:hypothetical protein